MKKEDLQARTKSFAIEIIQLTKILPRTREADIIARQIIRSATSVAANYRAACRGRSKTEFIAKLGTVVEEADETKFWLEMIRDALKLEHNSLMYLLSESNQITAIMVAGRKSASGIHKSSI